MAMQRIDDNNRKSSGIGIRLTYNEKQMVNHICSKNELDTSDMIRELIRKEYNRIKKDSE